MAPMDEGLVRTWVVYQGKRTTVSMDSLLFAGLCRHVGGVDQAAAWIRSAVARVDDLRSAEDPIVMVDKAGMSRLIQRMLFHELLRLGPEGEDEGAGALPASSD